MKKNNLINQIAMSCPFSTPSTASGILSDAELNHGGDRKKRKGSHRVWANQADQNHLFHTLKQMHEGWNKLEQAVWQKNCEIHLKNREIQLLQTSCEGLVDENMELQSDVRQLKSKVRKLETEIMKLTMSKTHGETCIDMFLPMDNDHLHVDCRLSDKRERAKEIFEKPFDIRPHLSPGFPNMKLTDGFDESANQSTFEMGAICADILGHEIPTQKEGDNFLSGFEMIPNALDRLMHWVQTLTFTQKNGGAANVARCIEVKDKGTMCHAFGSTWMPKNDSDGWNAASTLDPILLVFEMSLNSDFRYGVFYPATGLLFPSKNGGFSLLSNDFRQCARKFHSEWNDSNQCSIDAMLTRQLVHMSSLNKHRKFIGRMFTVEKMWVVCPHEPSAELNRISKSGHLRQLWCAVANHRPCGPMCEFHDSFEMVMKNIKSCKFCK